MAPNNRRRHADSKHMFKPIQTLKIAEIQNVFVHNLNRFYTIQFLIDNFNSPFFKIACIHHLVSG